MFLYVPSYCKSDATGLCHYAGQRRPVPAMHVGVALLVLGNEFLGK